MFIRGKLPKNIISAKEILNLKYEQDVKRDSTIKDLKPLLDKHRQWETGCSILILVSASGTAYQ